MTINQALNEAVGLYKTGNIEVAKRLFSRIIQIEPNQPDANHNMGRLLFESGNLKEALPYFKTALEANFGVTQYWFSYIDVLFRLQRFSEASELFSLAKDKGCEGLEFDDLGEKINASIVEFETEIPKLQGVIEDGPYAYLSHFRIGAAFQKLGKLGEAIETYNKSLSLKPDYAEAHNNMGITLAMQGKLEEAIGAYNKALSLKPDYADAYNNMGIALKDQSKLEEAIEAYNKSLSLKPDYAEAYNNMGIALKEQGKLDEAIEAYNKALSLKPNYAGAYSNMGNCLKEQGKLEEAIEAYHKALAIQPDYVEAYYNVGNALNEQGKLEEAIKAYKKALALKPDYVEAHYNLSFALLNNSRLKEGLNEYEWRWKNAKGSSLERAFSQPLWNGQQRLRGKRILLWCEQGVGDTINWSSRLPLISAQAKHCILECQEKLVPLLTRSFPNIEIKPEDRSRDPQRDDFDFHLPMGSLYKHFISEVSENTKPDAFLIPDPVRIKFWRKRLGSLGKGPYIGVSWKSSNMSPKRLLNYAPISDWSPILTLPELTLVNLQYTDFSDDLTKIQNELGVTVHNFDDLDHYNDLDDVAALSAALDIVVSTKTTVPLISAGVGTLTKLANWRQSDWSNILVSPVGPSVDIFERNTWDPWDKAFSLIAEDIVKLKNDMHSQMKVV